LPDYNVVESDVLVIGAGSGSMAAINACDQKADVVLIDKYIFGKSGSTNSSFGIVTSYVKPPDSPEALLKDLVRSGEYLNNQELVEIFVNEISEGKVLQLEKLGVVFDRTPDGNYVLYQFAGHSYPRLVRATWNNAPTIWKTVVSEVLRRGIRVMNEVMVTRLLTNGGRVVGATGLNVRTGEFIVFRAKSTILATGGATQLYGTGSISAIATTPIHVTGDGYAMAYRAGAELMDMEFTQYIPAFVYPNILRGINISEPKAFGPETKLYNIKGERFMSRYDPEHMEATTKDIVCRAMIHEVREGRGTEHGGILMDLTHIDKKSMLYDYMISQTRRAGIDMSKDYLEAAPSAHYTMGGVRIGTRHESNLPGLYAVAEVASGLHGANRVAGCSVADIIVFGARCGRCAAEDAKTVDRPSIDFEQADEEYERIYGFLERRNADGIRPHIIKRKIQNLTWENIGVVKTDKGLARAIAEIQRIREEDIPRMYVASDTRRYNQDWVYAIETINMLDVAEMMARASLLRKETRGAHDMEDHPLKDDKNWLKNIIMQNIAGKMTLTPRDVKLTKLKPGE